MKTKSNAIKHPMLFFDLDMGTYVCDKNCLDVKVHSYRMSSKREERDRGNTKCLAI